LSQLEQAIALWRAGRTSEAARLCDQLVAAEPDHVDGLRLLAEIATAQGRHADAAVVCRRILLLQPRDAATLRRLASAASLLGDDAAAVMALEASLLIEPGNARALNNLGRLLLLEGQCEAAVTRLTAAIAADPGYAIAFHNLGLAERQQGHHARALDSFRRAVELNGSLVAARIQVARALYEAGDLRASGKACLDVLERSAADAGTLTLMGLIALDLREAVEAMRYFERAHSAASNTGDALAGRALALALLGRREEAFAMLGSIGSTPVSDAVMLGVLAEALACLGLLDDAHATVSAALARAPQDARVLCSVGAVRLARQDSAGALQAFEAACVACARRPAAHFARGHALQALGRIDAALAAFEEAARLDPIDSAPLLAAGRVLMSLARYDTALPVFRAALALVPQSLAALEGRAMSLYGLRRHEEALPHLEDLVRRLPDLPYLPGVLLDCRLNCCDWSDYELHVRALEQAILRGERVCTPFGFLMISHSASAQRACARIYADDLHPPSATVLAPARRASDGRIRIGYLSADFQAHATAQLMAGLFERHDRTRFEVTALSIGPPTDDAISRRLKRAFERFEDLHGLDDAQSIDRIRALEIDILVDLKGYTFAARPGILAGRPAPVQVNYLGYPGTMGVDYVDYLIADHRLIPPDAESDYSEAIVRLPGSYQVNDRQRMIAPASRSRRDFGLPESHVVYCCFNGASKFTPAVYRAWMRVLGAVGGSVLWVLAENPTARANLARVASECGVDPARVVFADKLPVEQHLARYRLADLFLDTTPYNAHTTASDALWAGCPVLSMSGSSFAGRVGESLLYALGAPDLVATSLADYEAKAIALGQDRAALARLRERVLAAHDSPLFDTDRTRRQIEQAFETLSARARAGQRPESFDVADDGPTPGLASDGA
jgi:protein O-GlcNAc transferase